jgi:16S rRNA C967 or C1407 C5-methylase (RsmB/RsmF family)
MWSGDLSTDLGYLRGIEHFMMDMMRLLHAAAGAVRSGGVLVYATCSLFRRENAEEVQAFLATHPEFSADPFEHPLTSAPTPGMAQIWLWDGVTRRRAYRPPAPPRSR